MGQLTTHVLDTARGKPADNMNWALYRADTEHTVLTTGRTNADGLVAEPILSGADFVSGIYELVFYVAEYFRNAGLELPDPAFLDEVVIRFGIAEPQNHYHVPLLISPYGYSTYRGS